MYGFTGDYREEFADSDGVEIVLYSESVAISKKEREKRREGEGER